MRDFGRREVLRGVGGAAGLALGGGVLAACGSGNASASGGASLASHDAIVAAAKKERFLNIETTFTSDSYDAFKPELKSLYPFLNITFSEGTGEDAQRIVLELESDRNSNDSIYFDNGVPFDNYLPFVDEGIDLLKLSKAGIVKIPTQMIDAAHPDIISAGSVVTCLAINPKLLNPADAPKTWTDLLDPKFGGGKMLLDIKPSGFASLIPLWGISKVLSFAQQLLANKPTFVRGDTASLTQLAAGAYALKPFCNYQSAYRIAQKQPENLQILILEPVPVRLAQIEFIRKGTAHPNAALLYHEYLASAAAQKIIDVNEPKSSSIYYPGSSLNKLVAGKQTSVATFADYHKLDGWGNQINKAWGFPSAVIKGG